MNLNVVFFSNEFFQCKLVTEDWWDCTDSAWGFCESWKWDFPWELTSCKLQNVQRLIDRFVATNGFTLVVARKLYRENCTNGFTFVATNGFIVSGIQKWRLEGCAGLIWRRIFFLAVLVSLWRTSWPRRSLWTLRITRHYMMQGSVVILYFIPFHYPRCLGTVRKRYVAHMSSFDLPSTEHAVT